MYYYCTILGRIFITIYSKKARNIAAIDNVNFKPLVLFAKLLLCLVS